jgi:type II secretory pathway component GspD/PulD (secretin)
VEDSGALNLHLQPEVSDAAAPVGGNPATTVRRADTYVRVEPGQTIVLGGLIRDIESKVSTKIPLLGDIPLVGTVFRSSRQVKQRTEVVIMITPRLIEPKPEQK